MDQRNSTELHNNLTMNNSTTFRTLLSDQKSFNTFSTGYYFQFILSCFLCPILMIIGIIGNALTVKIFGSKKKQSASSLFIKSLAIADILLLACRLIHTLYVYGLFLFPQAIHHIPLRSLTWFWMSKMPKRAGKLLTIGIMSERLVAVRFPFRLRQVWTIKRTKIIIVILVTVSIVTALPGYIDVLYFSIQYTPVDSAYSSLLEESVDYLNNAKEWSTTLQFINILVFDCVPLLVICVLCIIVSAGVNGLLTSERLSFSDTEFLERRKKEKRITITMLTVSSLLILFCGFYEIVTMLNRTEFIDLSDVPLEVTAFFLVLFYLNSMINFIIYGLTDESLRKEYIKQFKCEKCIHTQSRIRNNEPSDSIE